jgi:hypothetical protein
MASYTGMSNLQNHPHRSGFDIGRKNAFTAKVGELLPVYWDISMPGDKYKFNVEYFTRTQPVETSAYTRLREYFDFYAVPLRLLWKSAPSVLTQMQNINQIQALSLTQNLSLGSYLPAFTLDQFNSVLYRLNGGTFNPGTGSYLRNCFGFNRADLCFKLLNYLGYGNVVKTVPSSGSRWWSTLLKNNNDSANYTQQYIQNNYTNIFPLLAYQKIYQDFFRWSQWESANPSSYNVDYYSGVSQLQGQKNLADAQAMQALSNVDWSKMTKETRDYLKATGLARAQLGYSKEVQELDNMAFAGRLLQAQGTSQLLDAEAKTVLNRYLDQQQQADLNVKASEYYNQMSHGHLNYNQAKKVLADEVLTYARAKGQKISNKVAEATADSLIRASNASNHSNAEFELEAAKFNRERARSRSIEDWYRSRNEGKKYKYYDADKAVHYGTSIGNTIGNFLPW